MIIFCLFDGSGIAALPWAQAGHTAYCFNADDADHGEYEIKMRHENINYVNKWIEPSSCFADYPDPDLIIAFPSCTELAGCGEKHERSEGQVSEAIAMAKVAERLGGVYG